MVLIMVFIADSPRRDSPVLINKLSRLRRMWRELVIINKVIKVAMYKNSGSTNGGIKNAIKAVSMIIYVKASRGRGQVTAAVQMLLKILCDLISLTRSNNHLIVGSNTRLPPDDRFPAFFL